MKSFPILYSRSSTGKVQQWQIFAKDDYFYTIAGQVFGALTESKPNRCLGKNIGKSNETTPREQALLEAQAKWEKKVKEGYKEDISKIDEISFFEPMTAKKFKEHKKKVKYPVGWEDKLNGGRGVLWNGKDGLWLYSRTGEKWNCVGHIIQTVASLFQKHPNLVLDGELFNPSLKNNLGKMMSLVSVMRKPDEITAEEHAEAEKIVQFHVYDAIGFNGVTKDTPWEKRKEELEKLVHNLKYVVYHPYYIANSEEDVNRARDKSVKNKSEGIMIKIFGAPYENKRSKYFLKFKNFEDDEFEVVGLTEGSGDWSGCVSTAICKLPAPTPDGKETFETNFRGERPERAKLWSDYLKNPKKYSGKKITVTYQELSVDGVPLIPYADPIFRDYE